MMAYECIMGKIPFKVYTEMDLKRIVIYIVNIGIWLNNIPWMGWCNRWSKRFYTKNIKKESIIKNGG